jgi:hypothetical protein
MKMQVSEQGDEILIEMAGVAGRHQRILQALVSGPTLHNADGAALNASDISVRAGKDEMHIRLKAHAGRQFDALSIYRHLRHALIEEADPGKDGGGNPGPLSTGAVTA